MQESKTAKQLSGALVAYTDEGEIPSSAKPNEIMVGAVFIKTGKYVSDSSVPSLGEYIRFRTESINITRFIIMFNTLRFFSLIFELIKFVIA